ncbi:unnamed protein product, partial [Allacma fusca]
LLHFLKSNLVSADPMKPSTRGKVNNVFLEGCMNFPLEQLEILFSNELELPSYNDNYVNNLVENCGSNLFTPSMKFSSLDVKTHFVTAGFPELIGIIIFNLFDIFA